MKSTSRQHLPIAALGATLMMSANLETASGVVTLTFDDPLQLDPTFPSPPPAEAPVWRADRYPAEIFEIVNLSGENVLEFGVSQADRAGARGGSFNSGFYNTQGYKLTIPGSNSFVSADFLIPSARPSDFGAVSVGLWGKGVTEAGVLSSYPIFVYRAGTADPDGFYYWDFVNGGYLPLVQGTFEDQFYNLRSELDRTNNQFLYEVKDSLGTTIASVADTANSTYRVDELFLNMSNTFSNPTTASTQTYSVFVDNVSFAPEPSRALLIGIAFTSLALRRRRCPALATR